MHLFLLLLEIADNKFMSIKALFSLIGKVLIDWRVIVTVIAMFVIVTFAKYVTTYSSKPKKNKKQKPVAATPAPAAPADAEPPRSDFSEKDAD